MWKRKKEIATHREKKRSYKLRWTLLFKIIKKMFRKWHKVGKKREQRERERMKGPKKRERGREKKIVTLSYKHRLGNILMKICTERYKK